MKIFLIFVIKNSNSIIQLQIEQKGLNALQLLKLARELGKNQVVSENIENINENIQTEQTSSKKQYFSRLKKIKKSSKKFYNLAYMNELISPTNIFFTRMNFYHKIFWSRMKFKYQNVNPKIISFLFKSLINISGDQIKIKSHKKFKYIISKFVDSFANSKILPRNFKKYYASVMYSIFKPYIVNNKLDINTAFIKYQEEQCSNIVQGFSIKSFFHQNQQIKRKQNINISKILSNYIDYSVVNIPFKKFTMKIIKEYNKIHRKQIYNKFMLDLKEIKRIIYKDQISAHKSFLNYKINNFIKNQRTQNFVNSSKFQYKKAKNIKRSTLFKQKLDLQIGYKKKSLFGKEAISKYQDLQIFDSNFSNAFIQTFYNIFHKQLIQNKKHLNFVFNKYIDVFKNQKYFDIPNGIITQFYKIDENMYSNKTNLFNQYLQKVSYDFGKQQKNNLKYFKNYRNFPPSDDEESYSHIKQNQLLKDILKIKFLNLPIGVKQMRYHKVIKQLMKIENPEKLGKYQDFKKLLFKIHQLKNKSLIYLKNYLKKNNNKIFYQQLSNNKIFNQKLKFDLFSTIQSSLEYQKDKLETEQNTQFNKFYNYQQMKIYPDIYPSISNKYLKYKLTQIKQIKSNLNNLEQEKSPAQKVLFSIIKGMEKSVLYYKQKIDKVIKSKQINQQARNQQIAKLMFQLFNHKQSNLIYNKKALGNKISNELKKFNFYPTKHRFEIFLRKYKKLVYKKTQQKSTKNKMGFYRQFIKTNEYVQKILFGNEPEDLEQRRKIDNSELIIINQLIKIHVKETQLRNGDLGYVKYGKIQSYVMICCTCGCIQYSDYDQCKEDIDNEEVFFIQDSNRQININPKVKINIYLENQGQKSLYKTITNFDEFVEKQQLQMQISQMTDLQKTRYEMIQLGVIKIDNDHNQTKKLL